MLLDTCAVLWLASEPERISPETLALVDDAPAVYVSTITGFEIALTLSEFQSKWNIRVWE